MSHKLKKFKTLLALILLVSAPSCGVLAAMYLWPNQTIGKSIFAISKIWILLLPIVWLRFVDKCSFSLSLPRNGGLISGLLSGLMISVIIYLLYYFFGDKLINQDIFREQLKNIGLNSRFVYICGMFYWITINSVLEEYVWRWFCTVKLQVLVSPIIAILCSAIFFTIHHFLAMYVYFSIMLTIVCSLGIFIGAAVWSWLYIRYGSIWPGYISHAVVDLCVFGIGFQILFC